MKKQNKLVIDVLTRLSTEGVLDHILIIGSWCSHFYKDYFSKQDYNPRIKTRDIDFLVPLRPHFSKQIDLEEVLSSLGFEIEFFGKGYMKLESEELIIDFLIPEVGPNKEKPVPLPDLKLNAQPLRHLSHLWRDPIEVAMSGITLHLPHPADYAVHKLIIAGKRAGKEKAEKDRVSALEVIQALIDKGEQTAIEKSLGYLSKTELKVAKKELEHAGYSF